MNTENLAADAAGIARASDLLRAGDCVAFPTETVYGLGADATQSKAVARIFAAKGRPSFNPLIVHVPNIDMASELVHWTDKANLLAEAFWPGPLTLVLPHRTNGPLSTLVTAGLQSVALRVPAHPVAQNLLAAAHRPVAAPSANPSGSISPTKAAHVHKGLGGKIAAVLDGGPTTVGLESTIVGLTDEPRLLRAGGVIRTEIEACLEQPLKDASEGITAPGQLASHYAPASTVRLNVLDPDPSELFLGFGPGPCDLNLSASGDLVEAAANLFDHLHRLDARNKPIAVAPIPETGLGVAINDRLRRAAAPRN